MELSDRRQGSSPGPASEPARGSQEQRIRAYQSQLRRLASELSLAEARERREIASDLHDNIGQALAYVAQKVRTLQGNAVFSGMDVDFSEILTILNQAIRYTRDLTVEISPPVLYELGLPAAIDWLADRSMHRHKLAVHSHQSGEPREVSDDVRVFLFKAVQELITNVAKHARATHADVHIHWRDDGLEIVVSDDGLGFDTTSFENGLADADCFGLFSIRERLSYIGGRLSIESAPGHGTRVCLATAYRITPAGAHDQSTSRR
jgi:signal transduction histidine kinase